MSNIHRLHSFVICVRSLSVFMRKFVAALVLERVISMHRLHSFVICGGRLSVFMRKFVAALVLERVIYIDFIRLLFVFAA